MGIPRKKLKPFDYRLILEMQDLIFFFREKLKEIVITSLALLDCLRRLLMPIKQSK